MRFLRTLCVFSVLTAASFQMKAQSFTTVNVHIPYSVAAGGKLLSPGDYTIRPLSGSPDTFVVLKDGRRAETVLRAVFMDNPDSANKTDIVLHSDGEGFTMDEMWVAGYGGYEFLGNKTARSREAERKIAVIPASTSQVRGD